MDGSNGNNAGSSGGSSSNPTNPSPQQQQRMHPGDSSRAVRAELEAKRRANIEKHRRFQPSVREQIGRVFGDTSPAWYARARLLTRTSYAQLAELSVVGLAVGHDRLLSDGEARAVTEHVARGADRMALISWSLTGLSAFLTWRGRHTLRFPLWTPQVLPPPRGAILRKTMWHGARYIAYSVATSVTLQAPLMAYNVMYEKQQMAVDERLRQLVRDEEGNYMGRKKEAEDWSSNSFGSGGGDDAQQQQQQQSIQEAAQTGWDTYKQSEQQQQQQQQQYGQRMQSQASNAGWGSSGGGSSGNYGQSSSVPSQQSSSGWDSADIDDASPVAGSAPSDSPSPYGNAGGSGSTWDRLRQQSQRASPQQQQQQQQRWGGQQSQGQQQQQPGGQLSWGDAGDGADRAAQDKAQREFDQLVDRDRSGEGQARSGWSGR
ncbi:uncharacterized protein LMH87_009162 [Akanthomyces muscarius]|uniref:Uncharacterized protein n=1 Tax=Akanthomyces muscarius TaxID=2231603 RepID=A0A9W8UQE0_AKAMU|nr:uncharacterized protein LMH87_009162 [Akanthomyces muscarius]KAJ4158646.1 hypothetical protein LMH87_009162 [Akanthomyces muscarius]